MILVMTMLLMMMMANECKLALSGGGVGAEDHLSQCAQHAP
jgi:hypothetical protein